MLVLFSLLFATACLRDSGVNIEEDFPPNPHGVVIINEIEYSMGKGGYRWEKKEGLTMQVVTTDAASPNQIAANFEAIQVTTPSEVTIAFDSNPQISVFLWNKDERDKEVAQSNGKFEAPLEEGRYIYEVFAEWKNGAASYTFVIEVD